MHTELSWLVSDLLSVIGEATYDLDGNSVARGSIGGELQHSPLLTSFVEYRFIDASDNQLLGIGWTYQLTPKYTVAVSPEWDFSADEFRAVSLQVVRRFPDFALSFTVRHDAIRDDTIFGASLGLVRF